MIGTVIRYLLSAALAFLSRDALRQAVSEMRDTEPGSQLFGALQLVMGVSAALGALGVFRRARWAALAIGSWGIATAGLLASQPLFEPMEADAQQAIWMGAGAMLVAAAGAAWYARRLAAPRTSADPATQRQAAADRPPDARPAELYIPPAPVTDVPFAAAAQGREKLTPGSTDAGLG